MIIARQKRKENIVEYLIYMWQVEDLIRACHFDMDKIEECVISQYEQPENIKQEIRGWFQELIDMMRSEGVTENGHIQINKNVVAELTDLHLRLLKSPRENIYGTLYYKTLPAIAQLRSKSGGNDISELETCLTAVYGYLLLKMQGKEISSETTESIKQISSLLAFLAARFHEEEMPAQ
ncbi:MAG: DUF4924 family protein [Tannerella sp.]|jgi:hypothetical protein|nr:DUF4924 family protein [Tannerella sp.]